MPRVHDDYDPDSAGLRIPGLYRALVTRERDRCRRDDDLARRMQQEYGYHCRRPRQLLRALEANEAVVMPRWLLGHRRSVPPVDLPWDRRAVTTVVISPDDMVRPAVGRCGWPGECADVAQDGL
jgi:hypothetical protein